MKRKHPFLLFVLFATVLTTSCIGFNSIAGRGPIVSMAQDNRDFDSIDISHDFRVQVTRAQQFKVTVSTHENLADYVVVKQMGHRLMIGMEPYNNYRHVDGRVDIEMPELREVSLSGVCKAELLDKWQTERFEADLSGAASLRGQVDMRRGVFHLSGSSNVELSGLAQDLDLDASGVSHFEMRDFAADLLDISLSGASTAALKVNNTVRGDLSGASHLTYTGNPESMNVNTSGASSVRHLGL